MSVNFYLKEQKSFPCVIHGNGNAHKKEAYSQTKKLFLENQKFSQDIIKDATVVTWKSRKAGETRSSRDNENKKSILEICMEYYGHPLSIFDWPEKGDFWTTSQQRLRDAVNIIGRVNTEYIMWFDAYDVILLQPPSKILDFYMKHFSGCDMVFNAEKNHFPNHDRKHKQGRGVSKKYSAELRKVYKSDNKTNPNTSFKYMNSGCAVGRTDTLKELLEVSLSGCKERMIDQGLLRIGRYKMRDRIKVDTGCKLFVSMHAVKISDVDISID